MTIYLGTQQTSERCGNPCKTAHHPLKKSATAPLSECAAPSCIPSVAVWLLEGAALFGMMGGMGFLFLVLLPAVTQ